MKGRIRRGEGHDGELVTLDSLLSVSPLWLDQGEKWLGEGGLKEVLCTGEPEQSDISHLQNGRGEFDVARVQWGGGHWHITSTKWEGEYIAGQGGNLMWPGRGEHWQITHQPWTRYVNHFTDHFLVRKLSASAAFGAKFQLEQFLTKL